MRAHGLQLLEAGLRGNTSIRQLDLSGCALTDASAPVLARLISVRIPALCFALRSQKQAIVLAGRQPRRME